MAARIDLESANDIDPSHVFDIALGYRYTVMKTAHCGYLWRCEELPAVMLHDSSIEGGYRRIVDLCAQTVSVWLENGLQPPMSPEIESRLGANSRSQVNVRMSEDQRERLENFMRDNGFRSMSELMRVAALNWIDERVMSEKDFTAK